MIVNASTLIGIQKSFRALFFQSLEAYTPFWQEIAMRMDAPNTLSVDHNWLGRPPKVKEWIDSKALDQLLAASHVIQTKEWESTIQVYRPHIETDMLGLYPPRIRELAGRAARHPDALVTEVRVAGETLKAYDGKNFYATNHVEGKSGNQSNLVTGTGVTLAQVTADFNTAKQRLREFKDDRGEPYNDDDVRVRVEVPPVLEAVFRDLLNATMIPSGSGTISNTLVGAATLKVNNRLSGNSWYIDVVGDDLKPFIYQVRKNANFVDLIDASASDTVFLKQMYAFSMEASYNVGTGLYQKSIKVKN